MNNEEPPKQAKALSAAVQARLNLAKEIYNLTIELQPVGSYTPNLRNTAFYALADLVQEHFGAIILLVEHRQFFGSAFALFRPLIETYLRAVWIQSIATEEELAAIAERKKDLPKFSVCRAAVDAYFTQNGVSGIYDMGNDFVKSLHGFTHSGLEQIENRINITSLEVTPYAYPETNVIALLDQAGRFAVMATMIAVQGIEGNATVMSPKVELLQQRFITCCVPTELRLLLVRRIRPTHHVKPAMSGVPGSSANVSERPSFAGASNNSPFAEAAKDGAPDLVKAPTGCVALGEILLQPGIIGVDKLVGVTLEDNRAFVEDEETCRFVHLAVG